MPPNFTVLANVVDIRTDVPRPRDTFWIDTNVWYWLTYSRASLSPNPPRFYQTKDYPDYIAAALRAKATLYRCELSLAELAAALEKSEREIFEATTGADVPVKLFRHNYTAERLHVVSEVNSAWGQVTSMAKPVHAEITDATCGKALQRLSQQKVDGYDAFILEALQSAGISEILTDDGDFSTVPGVTIYTANRGVLQAAAAQNRLIKR
jgi:predicted nucleic acid-binding protein